VLSDFLTRKNLADMVRCCKLNKWGKGLKDELPEGDFRVGATVKLIPYKGPGPNGYILMYYTFFFITVFNVIVRMGHYNF
jgi:hypothetical protein